MHRAGKARHLLFRPDDQEVNVIYPEQLPCGCYEGEECSDCSPWGPSIEPAPRAADRLLEARARVAHLEDEARVMEEAD